MYPRGLQVLMALLYPYASVYTMEHRCKQSPVPAGEMRSGINEGVDSTRKDKIKSSEGQRSGQEPT